jgi:hypothetical protein
VSRQIVIVISDLYFPPHGSGEPQHAAVPRGLEYLARFGQRRSVEEGWRAWLARWLDRDDLAGIAPASIAAASTASGELDAARGTAWFATPAHVIAGLTSLHLDRRSLLSLPAEDLARLAEDFSLRLGDSELMLTPTDSGIFLLRGLQNVIATTTEPAHAIVSELEASLPTGPSSSVLKRLGAELEMWLHDHPVNQARARRGELPVSTLWIWGGGADAPIVPAKTPALSDLALGSDPYLVGLWRLQAAKCLPLPDSLPKLSAYPGIERRAVVIEVTPLLHANPQWTVYDALTDLDRRFLVPALAELREGSVTSVVFIANDTALHVQRRDRFKLWRARPKSPIEAL